MNAIETYQVGAYTVQLHYDDMPYSPRDWDNLGTMVFEQQRQYMTGEENMGDFSDVLLWALGAEYIEQLLGLTAYDAFEQGGVDELTEIQVLSLYHALDTRAVVLPLRVCDSGSSGASIRVCAEDQANGYIYCDRDTILREYGRERLSAKLLAQVEGILRAEVEVYDQYLRGEVYGFIVTDPDGKPLDGCWGFFGPAGLERAKESAQEAICADVAQHRRAKLELAGMTGGLA